MKQFKQVMTVAGFTFRDAVRKKSFWVTNILYIVVVLGASLLLPSLTGGGSSTDYLAEYFDGASYHHGYTCYYLDESGEPLLEGAAGALADTGMEVLPITAEELETYLDLVREDSSAAVLLLRGGEFTSAVIYTKDYMSGFPAGSVEEILNFTYRTASFAAAGYEEETSREILATGLMVTSAPLQNISNYVVGMALMMMMFMTIYVYGYGVAMSVATEKSTRVMETLIVSAKPSRVLLGKCLGMGAVGLAQLGGVLLLAVASMKWLVPSDGLGGGLALPDLSFERVALLVLYFLLGYALFSMINSMCGAMVSKMEDLQSAMMPAALVSLLSFYGAGGVSIGGGGLSSKLTMLIPFTAPYAAPNVLLSGEYDRGLIAASVGILLVTIALVSYISGKVYSASVLHYGGRLKFSDIRRMLKNK